MNSYLFDLFHQELPIMKSFLQFFIGLGVFS
ncbi:MAG: hypothetical protein RL614_176, partial [Pseudomonadota bacterium]